MIFRTKTAKYYLFEQLSGRFTRRNVQIFASKPADLPSVACRRREKGYYGIRKMRFYKGKSFKFDQILGNLAENGKKALLVHCRFRRRREGDLPELGLIIDSRWPFQDCVFLRLTLIFAFKFL